MIDPERDKDAEYGQLEAALFGSGRRLIRIHDPRGLARKLRQIGVDQSWLRRTRGRDGPVKGFAKRPGTPGSRGGPRGSGTSEDIASLARRWGSSYSTLYRLMHAQLGRVTADTAKLLLSEQVCGSAETRSDLMAHFPTEATEAVYYDSIKSEALRLGGADRDILAFPKDIEREVVAFRKDVRNVGGPPSRADLGLCRVLSPFVAWTEMRKWLLEEKSPYKETRLRAVRRGLRQELELIRIEMKLLRKAARLG